MDFNLVDMLSNPAALAATVAGITAWLKARLGFTGNTTVLVSFVVSAVLIALGLISNSYPQLVDTLILLVVGAVGAGGGMDILKGITGGSGADK